MSGLKSGEYYTIDLLDSEGEPILDEVFTYVAVSSKRRFDLHTSEEYSKHILKGLSNLDVPSSYLDYINFQIKRKLGK